MQKLHIIYIPGLGDDNVAGQRRAVKLWRLYGVQAEMYQMLWADGVAWEYKFNALLHRIDELHDKGLNVCLVGVSAGASAVINAYAAREQSIAGVVLIAGKVNHAETVGSGVRSSNPSFWSSIQACEQSLALLGPDARVRLQSRFAIKDSVVSEADSRVPGAYNRRVFSIGHVSTIAAQITLGAPSIVRFLKGLAKQ